MSAGLNRIILAGRLTADPEVRYTKDELPIARFSLAIDRPAKKDGNRETDFINIVAWRGLAKICGEYLKKGKLIAVEGRLQLRKYKDKNGQTKTFAEVVASNMQMLDYKFFKKTESSSETSDDSGSDIELIEATKSSK